MYKVFEVAAIPSVAHWFLIGIIVLILAIAGAFSWTYFKGSQAFVAVSFNGVEVHFPFYGRIIPLSDVIASETRIVNLDEETSLAPSRRTNGIGLPGYQVGWFKLKSGDKALLALTSRDRVLFMPTTRGYVLLVSANDPDGLLAALRERVSG